jgi:hypothetical protein
MKPIHSLVLISFVSITCFSQQIRPLDKFQFDSTYRIVGLPHLYHNNYKKYAFILENPADMETLNKAIILEQKTDRVFELHRFILYIIKSNEIVGEFIISPGNNNMPINGEFYQFNFSIIRELSRKHPLHFATIEKSFLSRREYENYYEGAKLNLKFLFLFTHDLRYEGTFELVVPKSDSISNPKEAIDSLTRQFHEQQLTDFNIVYTLSQENTKNTDRMVMHVQASKNVFDLYKPNPAFRKRSWVQNKLTARSVWRK